jgi:hypothetical protein
MIRIQKEASETQNLRKMKEEWMAIMFHAEIFLRISKVDVVQDI